MGSGRRSWASNSDGYLYAVMWFSLRGKVYFTFIFILMHISGRDKMAKGSWSHVQNTVWMGGGTEPSVTAEWWKKWGESLTALKVGHNG